jgi:hypothetical protein
MESALKQARRYGEQITALDLKNQDRAASAVHLSWRCFWEQFEDTEATAVWHAYMEGKGR